ncbi:MAG: hypothetical protein ACE5EQ_06135 [Phycisphaerae bacterium]
MHPRSLLPCLVIMFAPSLLPCACAPVDRSDADSVDAVFGGPGFGPGEFSYPRAIAVSPIDGCVYVVDKSVPARVQRFSREGTFEILWRMPESRNGKPTGLTVDRHNRVWVPDTHYARVICYDRDGHELFRFGSYGRGPGQFIFPTAVVLDRDENIYVCEYGGNDRISKFSPDRKYLFSFADKDAGAGWTDRPQSILIDDRDVMWISDCCNHRICRYDRDGKFLSAFAIGGSEPGAMGYPYGIAFDKDGRLLVADRGNNRIVRFDDVGRVLGTWGAAGRKPGELLQPWGVAVGTLGEIYCLDSWNHRVQVVDW